MYPIDPNLLKDKKHIHFIGIGGSGMFPLVQILHSKGYYITGSDNNESDTLALERKLGIPITMGQSAQNIEGADLIVHTAAIMQDNPELIAAKNSGVPTVERSILLGYLSTHYNNCVCVSGTHGKTTTTALLTSILIDAGIDPTAVIGGKLPKIGGNGRVGKSDVMVCEACEFVDTFLKLSPDISLILNIDEDHLDYFKNLDNIIKSFHTFADMTTKLLIVNGDDANTLRAVEGISLPCITFGFEAHNNYSPRNIRQLNGGKAQFDLIKDGKMLCTITLSIPGRHNILNTMAACAAAIALGVPAADLPRYVADFKGAGRRFEILGEIDGVTIADDYAHHPAELEVTLNTAKQMNFKRVWAVFQPFTYSRTAMLLDDFARVLSIPDFCVLSEIMGSREKNTYNIYSKDLACKIEGCVVFQTFDEIADYVLEHAEPGDLVITLGCGDIYKCAKIMLQKKDNKK